MQNSRATRVFHFFSVLLYNVDSHLDLSVTTFLVIMVFAFANAMHSLNVHCVVHEGCLRVRRRDSVMERLHMMSCTHKHYSHSYNDRMGIEKMIALYVTCYALEVANIYNH